MATFGNPSPWARSFPSNLVPAIVDLLLTAWADLKKPDRTSGEVAITGRLRECLRQNRDLRQLPFSIWPESPERSLTGVTDRGRIDLRFLAGYQEDVYFGVECKRLNISTRNGRKRSGATEYVMKGMLRFVDGRYSCGLCDGGMLSYVMDGKVDEAVKAVEKTMARKCDLLLMRPNDAAFCTPSYVSHNNVRLSHHRLRRPALRLHHVFLGFG